MEDFNDYDNHIEEVLNSPDLLTVKLTVGTINPRIGLSPTSLRPCWAHKDSYNDYYFVQFQLFSKIHLRYLLFHNC